MNWESNDPAAGAMACLDCGRVVAIGTACPCVHDAEFVSYADETDFWREQNLWSIDERERPGKHSHRT